LEAGDYPSAHAWGAPERFRRILLMGITIDAQTASVSDALRSLGT
jgi:hypothetical protein